MGEKEPEFVCKIKVFFFLERVLFRDFLSALLLFFIFFLTRGAIWGGSRCCKRNLTCLALHSQQ